MHKEDTSTTVVTSKQKLRKSDALYRYLYFIFIHLLFRFLTNYHHFRSVAYSPEDKVIAYFNIMFTAVC